MAKVTYRQIQALGACEEERIKFIDTFAPEGADYPYASAEVEITEALCVRYAQEFDFQWAAEYLLDAERMRPEYDEQSKASHAQYRAEAEPLRFARNDAMDKADLCVDRRAAQDKAWDEYEEAWRKVHQANMERLAALFARLYNDKRNERMWP